MMSGIGELPPITGFVLTSRKESPLVETVVLARSRPTKTTTRSWPAGPTGWASAVAFTSDAGLPLDGALGPAALPRQALRPDGSLVDAALGRIGQVHRDLRAVDGQMRVVVTALDKNDEFLNFLTMTGTAVGPDLKKPLALQIEQTAPGRYVGTFPAREAGSYFVTINPGRGMAPLRTGVNVPYSDEFRDRGANDALLNQLAAVQPKDGPPGQLIQSRRPSRTARRQAAGSSTPSATICPRPPAARTPGTG